MYYIGRDVHEKTISYCVKDAAGCVFSEGKIGSTRLELDALVKTLPQPRMIAMEATIFTGWIYDHLLPHAEQVKVAHPLMLRAIAAAKPAGCSHQTGVPAGAQGLSERALRYLRTENSDDSRGVFQSGETLSRPFPARILENCPKRCPEFESRMQVADRK